MLACAFTVALTACGGASAGAHDPSQIPAYTGRAQALFDDALEPAAFGYELGSAPPAAADSLVRERAQLGDVVVRARVTTVTSKNEDSGPSWQLGFRSIERLGGHENLPPDFTVQLGPTSPSAGILRAWQARLIGRTFVVFFREFVGDSGPTGEMDRHFHVAKDAPDENAAIRAALAAPMR